MVFRSFTQERKLESLALSMTEIENDFFLCRIDKVGNFLIA